MRPSRSDSTHSRHFRRTGCTPGPRPRAGCSRPPTIRRHDRRNTSPGPAQTSSMARQSDRHPGSDRRSGTRCTGMRRTGFDMTFPRWLSPMQMTSPKKPSLASQRSHHGSRRPFPQVRYLSSSSAPDWSPQFRAHAF